MTRISTRYAPHIAVLCAIVLIPVVVHSYMGLRGDDCAHPQALIDPAFASSQPAKRQATMKSAFSADQWLEGELPLGRDVAASIHFAMIRTWNPKRVYYRPEYRMLVAASDSHRIEWLEVDGERIPIHRPEYKAPTHAGPRHMAAYLLLYDSEPVENPYLAQLTSAPLRMLRGSRPMTLLMVWGTASASQYEAAEQRARTWILEALENYRRVCGP